MSGYRATLEVVGLECQAVGKKVNRKTQVQKPNLEHSPRPFDCERGEAYLLGHPLTIRAPLAHGLYAGVAEGEGLAIGLYNGLIADR